ncbi:hypothetical protein [Asticcacaulis machinosus]|uniref:DUF2975 domain-containing protein n=1 Tax=Asticcacaulis machinosus TaxID=2984211 RepID=A0ABT5HJ66_9CAUL|nr:hypothetical protein [Asticcacaulis machinosus]MDC7676289.1 hypothetical protein [Asticcacaulis machinosus]
MGNIRIPHGPLSLVIKVVVVVLALALIREVAVHLGELPVIDRTNWREMILIPAFWLGLLAPGFYLRAAWAASDVFARMDKGDPFGPAMIRGLKSMGSNLMLGAACAIVIAPTLSPLFDDRFRGVRYDAEIESVTIGLLGLVLFLMAQQGQALKSEMDSFV